MITDAQKARIKFHMGYTKSRPFSDAYLDGVYLFTGTISAADEVILLGDHTLPPVLTDLDGYNDFFYQGTRIATPYSILWNVEKAWETMNPVNVDASLFVSVAGSVKLRATELANRDTLYCFHRDKLAQFFEVKVNEASQWVSPYR